MISRPGLVVSSLEETWEMLLNAEPDGAAGPLQVHSESPGPEVVPADADQGLSTMPVVTRPDGHA